MFIILTDNISSYGAFRSPKALSTNWMGQQLVLPLHKVYLLEAFYISTYHRGYVTNFCPTLFKSPQIYRKTNPKFALFSRFSSSQFFLTACWNPISNSIFTYRVTALTGFDTKFWVSHSRMSNTNLNALMADQVEVDFRRMRNFRIHKCSSGDINVSLVIDITRIREKSCVVSFLNNEERYSRSVIRLHGDASSSYGFKLHP